MQQHTQISAATVHTNNNKQLNMALVACAQSLKTISNDALLKRRTAAEVAGRGDRGNDSEHNEEDVVSSVAVAALSFAAADTD